MPVDEIAPKRPRWGVTLGISSGIWKTMISTPTDSCTRMAQELKNQVILQKSMHIYFGTDLQVTRFWTKTFEEFCDQLEQAHDEPSMMASVVHILRGRYQAPLAFCARLPFLKHGTVNRWNPEVCQTRPILRCSTSGNPPTNSSRAPPAYIPINRGKQNSSVASVETVEL